LNLEQQRKQAKDLLRAHRHGNLEAAVRIARYLPRARNESPERLLHWAFTLSEAQFIIAREAGFSSWPKLKHHLVDSAPHKADVVDAIIDAALAGNDDAADAGLARDRDATHRSIHAAAAVADEEGAIAQLELHGDLANRRGAKRNWPPLLYLCCSRYRRSDPDAAAARLNIARRLIAAGADVNAAGPELGYTAAQVNLMFDEHVWHVIDGAAGRLASPEIVRPLLEAGADLTQTSEILSQAVRAGNLEVLKMLLDAGPKDWYQVGWALKACVLLEKPDAARILISHMARPRVPGAALIEAIRLERNPELIEILLGNDDHHPLTLRILREAYRAAVRHAQHAAAELLLRRGADDAAVTETDRVIASAINNDRAGVQRITTASEDDHRMLAWAIRTHRYDVVPLLLEAGLNPNVADRDGETPLHLAVRAQAIDTINCLLTAGARLHICNFEAETPLDAAVASADHGRRSEVIQRLLAAGARPATADTTLDREELNILFERAADAVAFGEFDTLRELLDEEPSLVHARSPRPHRATLLHYCGANGTEDPRQRTPPNAPAIAQLLIDRGADVNATCNFYGGGATTLGLVLTSIHPVRAGVRLTLVETLAKAGASEGLFAAATLGQLDQLRKFFAASSPAPSKAEVQSAFVWACQFGRTGVVDFLLDKGADITDQDGNGMTGLHMAAGGGHLDTVKLLIRRGAPLELKNVWGGTVLGNILWFAMNYDPNIDYTPIVEAVVAGGAHVDPDFIKWWTQVTPLFPSSKEPILELLGRYANG